MKTMLLSLIILFSSHLYALPVAKQINEVHTENIISVVSVPSYSTDVVNLAVAFEYSNPCVAEQSSLVMNLDDLTLSKNVKLYSIWDSNLICTAQYDPTPKWEVLNVHLNVGETITINNDFQATAQTPTPAICIKSLCSDGSARDPYTCACSNGFNN